MKRKIKFGVIGLGHIGIKHVDAIIKNKHAELIAVADKLSFKEIEKKRNLDLSCLKDFRFYLKAWIFTFFFSKHISNIL